MNSIVGNKWTPLTILGNSINQIGSNQVRRVTNYIGGHKLISTYTVSDVSPVKFNYTFVAGGNGRN